MERDFIEGVGGDVMEVPPVITCRSTFSVCGKLVGHFPICVWLKVVVAAIKRCATSVSLGWNNEVSDAILRSTLTETMPRVTDDPVWGDWCVNGNEFPIWVDASSLAMGVPLEANSALTENACWLWPKNDARHINLAELDVTLKGVNLALQWQANVLYIVTDSVCTHRCITDALTRKAWLITKVSSVMLIWRWFTTLAKTIEKYNLVVDVARIRSAMNRADALSRVLQWELTRAQKESEPLQQPCSAITHSLDSEQITSIYWQCGHPGIKQMRYFARMVDPAVDRGC